MNSIPFVAKRIRKLYEKVSDEIKNELEDILGKSFFSGDVADRIGDWEDMMREADRPDVPTFCDAPEDMREFFQFVYKNIVMVEAYNEGERMNIYDVKKDRNYPCFLLNLAPSGFALRGSNYVYVTAAAGSGSRFAFKQQKHAVVAGKKHTEIFRGMLEK